MPSPNPSFSWESGAHKSETPLLRDHIEKGDIEMRYIETERRLADIFTKPLDVTRFASLWGGEGDLLFIIPMAWFEVECILPCIYSILSSLHCISFIST
jgi:hypothetical protein